MARIAIIDRTDMTADQARVYDAAQKAGGPVGGPFLAYIRLPKLFEGIHAMRAGMAGGPLSRREQQLINLAVARHWGARYPWYAQCRASLAIGIAQGTIDAINAGEAPDLPDARERMCFTVARDLLANKRLSDQAYAAAEQALGTDSLVAAVAMTGSFSMTCLTANTFAIEPPADNPTPLAD